MFRQPPETSEAFITYLKVRSSSNASLKLRGQGLWVPAFAGTTRKNHTAIFRCRTGAPLVRPSAASMIALASMP
jgi:hypothetical protein